MSSSFSTLLADSQDVDFVVTFCYLLVSILHLLHFSISFWVDRVSPSPRRHEYRLSDRKDPFSSIHSQTVRHHHFCCKNTYYLLVDESHEAPNDSLSLSIECMSSCQVFSIATIPRTYLLEVRTYRSDQLHLQYLCFIICICVLEYDVNSNEM